MNRQEAKKIAVDHDSPALQRFYDEWFAMRDYIEFVDEILKLGLTPKPYAEWLKHEGVGWIDKGMRKPPNQPKK